MWIVYLWVKRDSKSNWESGIGIGSIPGLHDLDLIVDKDRKVVNDVYDYRIWPAHGAIVIDMRELTNNQPKNNNEFTI